MKPNTMKKTILYFLCFLLVSIASIKAQNSKNGYKQTNKDTIRVLLVFAEMKNDPNDPGSNNIWQIDSLPTTKDNYFDPEYIGGRKY